MWLNVRKGSFELKRRPSGDALISLGSSFSLSQIFYLLSFSNPHSLLLSFPLIPPSHLHLHLYPIIFTLIFSHPTTTFKSPQCSQGLNQSPRLLGSHLNHHNSVQHRYHQHGLLRFNVFRE
ncbi:hypothetical protein RIF29_21051 [Crotalaria pallida]|uniref:Uncharacterized protein n=1 Tax=Crotalaria pallida TaxID=3830 RepID=A0AAN9FAU6_CROPI